ncbi:hypothetical protein N7478_006199 [Penicillium angulare]|uniref:uncharacterized protein n=1 Tax=Penicillium angulare TaxID=116970 RepID=UPI00253F686B|nr:uncharacterized protein N7478_006199 [Penicillium angulare]KAJ5280827.1 hypothetical protein N7478_006199 [Penicillium angulare]
MTICKIALQQAPAIREQHKEDASAAPTLTQASTPKFAKVPASRLAANEGKEFGADDEAGDASTYTFPQYRLDSHQINYSQASTTVGLRRI